MLVGDTKVIHIWYTVKTRKGKKNSLKINSNANVSIWKLLNWIPKREAWLICILIKYFLVFVDCPVEVCVQTISQIYQTVYYVFFLIHAVSLCKIKIIKQNNSSLKFFNCDAKTAWTLKWGCRVSTNLLTMILFCIFIGQRVTIWTFN